MEQMILIHSKDIQFISLLISRLERISADSYWAHRASGVRGALLRVLSDLENGHQVQDVEIDALGSTSLHILVASARDKH